jgi:protein phosphatase 2C family protein 2/3
MSLGPICEELMDYCLAEKGNMSGIGCDNMTVIIVAFLRKRKPQEWYNWMAQKIKPQMPAKKAILLASNDDKKATTTTSAPTSKATATATATATANPSGVGTIKVQTTK